MNAIELVTPLSPDECAARLRDATDRDGIVSWFGSRPVVGRVSGRSVRLRKRIDYQNSFQMFLIGSLENHPDGAVLRGRIGMHPLVAVFMAVWFGGVAIIGGIVLVAALEGQLAGGQSFGAVVPWLMLAFGAGFVRFGRWVARNEGPFLVAFVADVIGAQAAPGTAPKARSP